MLLTLQCTASCRACGHVTTPVNGVVEELPCRQCGAMLAIPSASWTAVVEGLAEAGAELPDNGSGHEQFVVEGASLRVAFHRVEPKCPHCGVGWTKVPGGGDWACPQCQTSVSLRGFAWASDEGVTLIAEDRGLVSPEGVGLNCRGCGAPLDVGTERRARCGSCMSENVVPDDVYRRINAPDTAARWMMRFAESSAANPLAGVGVKHLGLGSDGVLYIVGGTSHLNFALLAFDPRARTLLWTLDLQECDYWPFPLPVGGGRVALVTEQQREVRFARDGALEPGFVAEAEIVDATVHAGDLVVCLHPLRALARLGLDGSKRSMWPPVGWFARLFGGGGSLHPSATPGRRPGAAFPGRIGVGHDGDLRMVWGSSVVRYSSEGEVVWSTPIPEALVSITAPVAAQDGTTYAVMTVGTEAMRNRLVRLRPDGSLDATVLDADLMSGLACEADGRVWVMASNFEDGVGVHSSLQCYDARGNLIWKGPTS